MDCWLSSGRLDGLTYLKVHEAEATNLQFWFYGLFKLWQMKRWHKIKSHHQVSLLKDKDGPQSVDRIHSKLINSNLIIECVSYSQTCRLEYPSVIFHRTEEKIKCSFSCQHSAPLSLSLFLMSLPASAVVFFTSSSWNEWTLLQRCGKLAGETLHSATPALSFYKCIMHFLSSSARCKKNPKALTC